MTEQIVDYFNSTVNETVKVRGCNPAIGKTFTFGTTDGPGIDWYKDTSEKSFFSFDYFSPKKVIKRLAKSALNASPDDEECHGVKKIVISQASNLNYYYWLLRGKKYVPTESRIYLILINFICVE